MYATTADFTLAFGEQELSELTGDDATIFAAAETKAAALIDGYLAAKYSLPLAATPTLVKGWALDISRFHLWDDRAPEEVRARYDLALEQLRDLSRGIIALPPEATGITGGVFFGGYSAERVFTADTLADY